MIVFMLIMFGLVVVRRLVGITYITTKTPNGEILTRFFTLGCYVAAYCILLNHFITLR